MLRRLLGVVLVLVAVAVGAFAASSDESEPAAAPTDATGVHLATPIWSVRRVPQPVLDGAGAQRLQAELTATLSHAHACFVVSGDGTTLASQSADAPLLPASTEKLLTGAAALAVFGTDTTLVTRVMVAKEPVNGAVDRLYFVGGGDFLLGTPDYQAYLQQDPQTRNTPVTPLGTLADAIVAKGVKRIPGGIVGDDSRYEQLRYLPTWAPNYRTEGQVGPLSALTVNRGFSSFVPRRIWEENPAQVAAEQLGMMLRERGVQIGASPIVGKAPGNAIELAAISSLPMQAVVTEMLRMSDNIGAELLAREIGVKVANEGTTAAGVRAINSELAKLGIPMAGVNLVDASGLSRENRATCQAIAGALALANRREFAALVDGLAVAGQSGTLADEFLGTPLAGHLRGKTGFLNGVTGLAGVIDGRSLHFAFIANDDALSERGAIALRAAVGDVIGRFPNLPAGVDIVPSPVAPAP